MIFAVAVVFKLRRTGAPFIPQYIHFPNLRIIWVFCYFIMLRNESVLSSHASPVAEVFDLLLAARVEYNNCWD